MDDRTKVKLDLIRAITGDDVPNIRSTFEAYLESLGFQIRNSELIEISTTETSERLPKPFPVVEKSKRAEQPYKSRSKDPRVAALRNMFNGLGYSNFRVFTHIWKNGETKVKLWSSETPGKIKELQDQAITALGYVPRFKHTRAPEYIRRPSENQCFVVILDKLPGQDPARYRRKKPQGI